MHFTFFVIVIHMYDVSHVCLGLHITKYSRLKVLVHYCWHYFSFYCCFSLEKFFFSFAGYYYCYYYYYYCLNYLKHG